MQMKDMLYRMFLKLEIYAHEVDAYLARAGGNLEFAADCVNRKAECERLLDIELAQRDENMGDC